jgi:hypothetical protein
VVSDLLRHFEFAAVLQIGRNAGRTESMIANPGFDAGRFCAPADDAVGVLLEEGVGCKLAGLAAGTRAILIEARVANPKAVKTIHESGPPARSFLALEPGVESAGSGPLHRTFSC